MSWSQDVYRLNLIRRKPQLVTFKHKIGLINIILNHSLLCSSFDSWTFHVSLHSHFPWVLVHVISVHFILSAYVRWHWTSQRRSWISALWWNFLHFLCSQMERVHARALFSNHWLTWIASKLICCINSKLGSWVLPRRLLFGSTLLSKPGFSLRLRLFQGLILSCFCTLNSRRLCNHSIISLWRLILNILFAIRFLRSWFWLLWRQFWT